MEPQDKIFILKDTTFRTQNLTAIFSKIFVNTTLETFFGVGYTGLPFLLVTAYFFLHCLPGPSQFRL